MDPKALLKGRGTTHLGQVPGAPEGSQVGLLEPPRLHLGSVPPKGFPARSPADLILRFLQPKLRVEGELYPRLVPRPQPPGQQQVPGVAVGEARTLHVAVSRHLDGLVSSVQVCEVIAVC